jgi:hypothetical protein
MKLKARLVLVVSAVALALAAAAINASSGSAAYGCSGVGCLPGSGYTFDRTWNCGLFYGYPTQDCWFPGVLGQPPSSKHTWGWGSADYDGVGHFNVAIYAPGGFYSEGDRLARACFYSSCNDQGGTLLDVLVRHYDGSGVRHTIYGHAKA